MKLSDFDYDIPEDRVAKYPVEKRDNSRLLILRKKTRAIEHVIFRDITGFIDAGDVLVLNDTKVLPVRLGGTKPTGGKAEITLLKELEKNSWEALVKGLNKGTIILTPGITARVSRINGTVAHVQFDFDAGCRESGKNDIKELLYEIGAMPLPVYIKRGAGPSDLDRYQTIYARNEGAVAAPTAGLHFTKDLLRSLKEKGVHIKTITLHVGYGTFRPVTASDIKEHNMDEESYTIPEATADAINRARAEGRRVIAVGTTVTRALEASAEEEPRGRVKAGPCRTSIFIYPGHRFRILDALLTNFHLPASTPIMLASAFAGLDLLKEAYTQSQKAGYRFYSYGDAMLIMQ